MWFFLIFTIFASPASCFNFPTPIVTQGNLSVNVERKCPSDWASFQRQKGLYCLKVFSAPYDPYTETHAQSLCNDIGARIAGIETISERNYIMRHSNTGDGRTWIGLFRNVKCITNGTLSIPCQNPYYAFFWGDSYVTGNTQILFTAGQPDNQNSYNGQQCAQMITASSTLASLYDDISCDVREASAIYSSAMYVCGMPAPIVSFSV